MSDKIKRLADILANTKSPLSPWAPKIGENDYGYVGRVFNQLNADPLGAGDSADYFVPQADLTQSKHLYAFTPSEPAAFYGCGPAPARSSGPSSVG